MKSSLRIFTALLFFVCTGVLPAQQEEFLVQKRLYNYSDGLPGNKVTCVAQDALGFIWVGTPYGLCRFDGQKFQLFTQGANGLRNRPVGALYPDAKSGLIIAYQHDYSDVSIDYDSVDVMDTRTLQVQPLAAYYRDLPFRPAELKTIWPANEFHPLTFFVEPYNYGVLSLRATAPAWVLDTNGKFLRWPRVPQVVIRFSPDEQPLVRAYTPGMELDSAAMILLTDHDLILSNDHNHHNLYHDEKGFVVTRQDSRGRSYIYFIGYDGTVRLLGNETAAYGKYTFDLSCEYENNYLGLGRTPGNVYFLFTPATGAVPVIGETDSPELKRARPISILHDRLGNYWICTTEGLLKVRIAPRYFHSLYSTAQETQPGNQSVRGIFANEEFSVVALTTHVNIRYDGKVVRVNHFVNHGCLYDHHTLWLHSFYLHVFDFKTGKATQRIQSISDEIWSMYPLGNGKFLLGCTKALDVYDSASNTIRHAATGRFPVPKLVYRFFRDSKGETVCVADNGIFYVDGLGSVVDYYGSEAAAGDHRFPFSGINDLHIDPDGTWWLATACNGLYRWDRVSGKFEKYGISNGFLSEKLCRIEEGDDGNLWISTDFGLARFDKRSGRAKVFTAQDGLPQTEFNRSSSFNDGHGNLYFGTIDGCITFRPSEIPAKEVAATYPFLITVLNEFDPVTNRMKDVSGELAANGFLGINGDGGNLSLTVLLLDLGERTHLYTYVIEGLDRKVNYSYDGQINLSNLPYGSYTIVVSAQCADGTWNEKQLRVPLRVFPPFYKTTWFLVLCAAALVLSVFLFFRYRERKMRREKVRLETVVGERTKALSDSLAEQTALLQEVHHRVKNNLQFIIAMLQMQINATRDETNKAVLKETSVRINSMSLVHEMLYNKDKLEFIRMDVYLGELTAKLKELVHDGRTPVEITVEADRLKFNVNDSVAMGMLTSEIVNNAIKYAFEGIAQPRIAIRLVYDPARRVAVYSIGDNGNGMQEEKKGKGLGLRLIDIFSRQLEAGLRVTNVNGLQYVFEIPVNPDEQAI